MRNQRYQMETGEIVINRCRMAWSMRRSKGESCFGIQGSRIFELVLTKDGRETARYERGWLKKVENEDDETATCLTYLIDKYGRNKQKKKE